MRYLIAVTIAGLVIAGLWVFWWWNHDLVERQVRQQLRQDKEQGKLAPEFQGVDIETLDLSNYSVRVSRDVMGRANAARFLGGTWYLWMPAVLLMCLGAAALIGRWRLSRNPIQDAGPQP